MHTAAPTIDGGAREAERSRVGRGRALFGEEREGLQPNGLNEQDNAARTASGARQDSAATKGHGRKVLFTSDGSENSK
jgi:hypothetical protein